MILRVNLPDPAARALLRVAAEGVSPLAPEVAAGAILDWALTGSLAPLVASAIRNLAPAVGDPLVEQVREAIGSRAEITMLELLTALDAPGVALRAAREALSCGHTDVAIPLLRALAVPRHPALEALLDAFEAGDGRSAKVALEAADDVQELYEAAERADVSARSSSRWASLGRAIRRLGWQRYLVTRDGARVHVYRRPAPLP